MSPMALHMKEGLGLAQSPTHTGELGWEELLSLALSHPFLGSEQQKNLPFSQTREAA